MKFVTTVALLTCAIPLLQAAEKPQREMPLLFEDDFENGFGKWEIVNSKSWELQEHGKGKSLSISRRKSEYNPKVRSPRHIALMKGIQAENFVLTFKVRSTKDTGNHRDCCIFFCYQNATEFYYVHLGRQARSTQWSDHDRQKCPAPGVDQEQEEDRLD